MYDLFSQSSSTFGSFSSMFFSFSGLLYQLKWKSPLGASERETTVNITFFSSS